jgi:hypothetical protein
MLNEKRSLRVSGTELRWYEPRYQTTRKQQRRGIVLFFCWKSRQNLHLTRDLPAVGEASRKDLLANGPAFAERLRSLVEKNKSLGGWDLTDEERPGYLSDAKQIDALIKEAPEIKVISPTLTIEDHLTLHRGTRTIEIRYLGALIRELI